MKLLRIFPQRTALAVLAGALLALALLAGCKKAAKPAPPAAPKPAAHVNTNAVPGASLPTEFVSVFDDSPPPGNKGRDPFNPDSTSRNPAAVEPKSTAPTAPVAPQLKLYSVTGSSGHWLAHINNQFLMLTDPATFPPAASIRAFASSRESVGRVPVRTKASPAKGPPARRGAS